MIFTSPKGHSFVLQTLSLCYKDTFNGNFMGNIFSPVKLSLEQVVEVLQESPSLVKMDIVLSIIIPRCSGGTGQLLTR